MNWFIKFFKCWSAFLNRNWLKETDFFYLFVTSEEFFFFFFFSQWLTSLKYYKKVPNKCLNIQPSSEGINKTNIVPASKLGDTFPSYEIVKHQIWITVFLSNIYSSRFFQLNCMSDTEPKIKRIPIHLVLSGRLINFH